MARRGGRGGPDRLKLAAVAVVLVVALGVSAGFALRLFTGRPGARRGPAAPSRAGGDVEVVLDDLAPPQSAPAAATEERGEREATVEPEGPAEPDTPEEAIVDPDAECEIIVRAGDPGRDVPRFVFGQNLEAADPKGIFGPNSNTVQSRTGDGFWDPVARRPVPEVLAFAKDIGVTVMRYPGGCLAHNFDWKQAVGPLEERPAFAFGVDEFLDWCRAAAAEPLITVSGYRASPQDAAALVEYLNAPADAAHPWARKRGAWGHPEPWGVTYLEMGNETDHGNHDVKPGRKLTADEYANWVVECSRRMRAVDQSIKIGAHMGTGTGPRDPWNARVLEIAGDAVDYIVIHTYMPSLWQRVPRPDEDVGRAAMAAGEQAAAMLGEYRELVRRVAGRDIPLAITEYNAGFVQEEPVPYRFSLAGALFAADYVRVFLEPGSNVFMANYWHMTNGYWGLVRGPRLPEERAREWKRMPAYWLYRLWGSHFGGKLVPVEVASPKIEFEGGLGLRPARAGEDEADVPFELSGGSGPGHSWKVTGDRAMTLEVRGFKGEAYPLFAKAPVPGSRSARLSFEARVSGAREEGEGAPGTVGIGMIDSRGWHATKSGLGLDRILSSHDWTRHEGSLTSQPGCTGMDLTWRLVMRERTLTARIKVRDLRVTLERTPPPYAALTACASRSADGKTLFVMVFNKHHGKDLTANVRVAGRGAIDGRYWRVTGPSLDATNLERESVRETVTAEPVEGLGRSGFAHTFPKHSMTAFEIDLRE